MNAGSVRIEPLRLPFDAALPMPGSKSHANRAIVAACLAPGDTILRHATPCDDVSLLVENVRKLGFDAAWEDKAAGTLRILGGLPDKTGAATLDCGNAGTTLRFLASLACLVPGDWTVTGDERMRSRPIGDLAAALCSLGADIAATNGCPPLRIRGGILKGGEVTLDASKSSQFLSSLLLVGTALPQGLTVTLPSDPASPTYIDLTQKVLRDFGVELHRQGRTYAVGHTTLRSPGAYDIEGDWSAAGAFLVLAELTGSRIDALNLRPDSAQGDRLLPAVIAALRGDGDRAIDVTDIPDQAMNLAVLAAHRKGATRITGAANLRLKECDRLAVIKKELGKAGMDVAEQQDGLRIRGGRPLRPAVFDPHGDHRMAMCFAIMGAMNPGMEILDPGCVAKSYPQFFADWKKLRDTPRCVAIVGMRGSGKSNLGKRLASKLKLKHVDTDTVFIKSHGEIAAFAAERGWPAFREEEEEIVEDCLRPGHVVSLGGGAIESDKTRNALARRSLVIWMQVREREMVERLKKLKRPPLTDLPLEEEVPMVLRKRTPLYESVATIQLAPSIHFGRQIPWLLSQLHKRCSW